MKKPSSMTNSELDSYIANCNRIIEKYATMGGNVSHYVLSVKFQLAVAKAERANRVGKK